MPHGLLAKNYKRTTVILRSLLISLLIHKPNIITKLLHHGNEGPIYHVFPAASDLIDIGNRYTQLIGDFGLDISPSMSFVLRSSSTLFRSIRIPSLKISTNNSNIVPQLFSVFHPQNEKNAPGGAPA